MPADLARLPGVTATTVSEMRLHTSLVCSFWEGGRARRNQTREDQLKEGATRKQKTPNQIRFSFCSSFLPNKRNSESFILGIGLFRTRTWLLFPHDYLPPLPLFLSQGFSSSISGKEKVFCLFPVFSLVLSFTNLSNNHHPPPKGVP